MGAVEMRAFVALGRAGVVAGLLCVCAGLQACSQKTVNSHLGESDGSVNGVQASLTESQTDLYNKLSQRHETIHSFDCGGGESISLDASSYGRNPDASSFGYALFYHFRDGGRYGFWIDGYTEDPRTGSNLAQYDGWGAGSLRDGMYADLSRPLARGGTPLFTPLPRNIKGVKAYSFETPAAKSYLYGRDLPPFMNIFIDPKAQSFDNFKSVYKCLTIQRVEINGALDRLATVLPSFLDYKALHLGGIVYGLPPYADPAFREQIEAFWYGDATHPIPLPTSRTLESVRLFPGQMARSEWGGKVYEIKARPDGDLEWYIDAVPTKPYEPRSNAPTPSPEIYRGDSTTYNIMYDRVQAEWLFGPHVCLISNGPSCYRAIEIESQAADGSFGYGVSG